jgi:hypothetical protein
MAYLTILAIGGFGLLIAGVSHYFVSRERRAILAAQGRLTEGEGDSPLEAGIKPLANAALPQGSKADGQRMTRVAAKHYAKRLATK